MVILKDYNCIPDQSAALERQVTELEKCFGDLQSMLRFVRSEESESPTKEVSLSCPVAEHLRQQTNRIRNICARIAYLIRRQATELP